MNRNVQIGRLMTQYEREESKNMVVPTMDSRMFSITDIVTLRIKSRSRFTPWLMEDTNDLIVY